MTISGKRFIQRFEQYCPLWLAEENDPCGLHIGTLDKQINRVMMTLDVRPEVVAEAIEKKVDLLIAKHPPIFKPISRLTEDDLQVKMYLDLIKHDIAVYAAHTNMDIIWDGLNDWFCEALDLQVDGYLKQTHTVNLRKLVVYIPETHANELRSALGNVGAGTIGNYREVSFSAKGIGRFTPTDGANPTIGGIGKPECVKEERVEVLYLETEEAELLKAMKEVHPYEEVAYDIFRVENEPITYGIGRLGHYDEPISIEKLVAKIKEVFQLDGLRLIQPNPAKKMIQTVAICGGTGGSMYNDAIKKEADVYITGDVYYHTAHDMQTNGLTVIDPGHHIEELCIPKFVEKMVEWNREENWALEIFGSTTNTNPFQFR